VFAVAAAGLDAVALSEVLELVRGEGFGQLRKEDHGGSTEACTEVGRACVDLAEVVVELVTRALVFKDGADLLDAAGPAVEDVDDVAAFVHGDDAHVVFLVDPDEELAVVCAEDAAVVGPVAASAGSSQQSRAGRLLEEVAVAAEFLGHFRTHFAEFVLLTLEVAGQAVEAHAQQIFDLGSVVLVGEGRE